MLFSVCLLSIDVTARVRANHFGHMDYYNFCLKKRMKTKRTCKKIFGFDC